MGLVLKGLNNKLNRLHERFLRLIYNEKRSTFEQLLDKDSSVPIHIRNLQTVAIEMCKVVNGRSIYITNVIFKSLDDGRYKLRLQSGFKIPEVNTVQRSIQKPIKHLRWGVLRK